MVVGCRALANAGVWYIEHQRTDTDSTPVVDELTSSTLRGRSSAKLGQPPPEPFVVLGFRVQSNQMDGPCRAAPEDRSDELVRRATSYSLTA